MHPALLRSVKVAVPALALAVVAAACSSSGSSSSSPPAGSTGTAASGSGGSYNVTLLADLTGGQSAVAISQTAGVQTYLKMINAEGGVNGKKINLTVVDGQSLPNVMVAGLQRALSGNTMAVLHAGSSAEFAAMLPIIKQTKTSVLTSGATDNVLYPPLPNVFMMAGSASQQAVAVVNGMKARLGGSLSGKKIAFVGLSVPYIDEMLADVKTDLAKDGASVGQIERYPLNPASFTSQAAEISSSKPAGVFDIGTSGDVVLIVKAMLAAGVKVPIVAYSAGASDPILKAIDSPLYSALLTATDPTPGTALYKVAQQEGYANDTSNDYFTLGWAQAAIVAEGLKMCGASCTPAQLTTSIGSISDFTVPDDALFGPVTFSATSHTALSEAQFIAWDPSTSNAENLGSPVPLG
jgi:branched-chain amino acid transport system substrate-binding protein